MTWKLWNERFIHGIEDDANYLVSYKDGDGKFCLPHRAYYIEEMDAMYLNDTLTAFPVACEIYMKMPEVPK